MATTPSPTAPMDQVIDAFTTAQGYASSATGQLSSFLNAMNNAVYQPPTLSLNWQTIQAPADRALPNMPKLPAIALDMSRLGSAPMGLDDSLTTAPLLNVAQFTGSAPNLVWPAAPEVRFGTAPSVPDIRDVAVPDAPQVNPVATPEFITLRPVTFGGIDLKEGWLDRLEDAPTLDLLAPAPYSYDLGDEYASAVLDKLKAVIDARLTGGTGLAPAVEQAIWDRARSRETNIALANEQEIMRASEALGFQLPTGTLAAQLRQAQQDYYDKLSGLSRDISIKQAELEQENLKQTIAAGIQLESQLMDYSIKIEQLNFEAAKIAADNAIQIHNAALAKFKALLEGYQAYASVYKTIIEGQLAKVEVYKAELQAEQTKADINKSLVEQYKAAIEAEMSKVEIYRAQVGAAQTLVQLEQARIGAAGEQIRAYVAQVNAETSKVEAYKAQVSAEATKIEAYKGEVSAYAARVGAQAEVSRAYVARYSALVQAKMAEWDGYRARVQAESTRIDALGKQSGAMLDSYKASTTAAQAQAELTTKKWEASMKQYEAGIQASIQTARINNDAFINSQNARIDAAKTGAQVYAQLTASAYGILKASASNNVNTNVSYNMQTA